MTDVANVSSTPQQLTPIQDCMAQYRKKDQPVPKPSMPKVIETTFADGDGCYRTACLGKIICDGLDRGLKHFQYDDHGFFAKGRGVFSTTSKGVIVSKLPNTFRELKVATAAVQEAPSTKSTWTFVRKSLEAVNDASTITGFLTASLKAIRFSLIVSFATDLMDWQEEVTHLAEAKEGLQKPYTDHTQENPVEKGRHALLRLVKLAASATAAIFTLLGIISGRALLSPVTFLALSAINVVFCIASKMYKEMMTHNLVAKQILADHKNLAIA